MFGSRMSSKKARSKVRPLIESVTPRAAIHGGEVEVRGSGFSDNGTSHARARFGSVDARLVVGGSRHLVIRVPEGATEGALTLINGSAESQPYSCAIGVTIAENLHPVSNPAVDMHGNIFTTRSGSRGEKLPVSVFKIDPNFNVKPFVSDIVNPTGLIFNRNGDLLISGRNNGSIYSVSSRGQVEVYAEGMGVATGLAFDEEENLYVGDRTGTIFKISPDRQIFVFATLEPSISAYHLAMGPDQTLYVTGPTTSSFDCVYGVNPKGEVDIVYRGFGRPQGMVVDAMGDLYLAASHAGRKGIFLLRPGVDPEQVVSGPGIVGLNFLPTKEMVVATTNALFRVDTASLLNN